MLCITCKKNLATTTVEGLTGMVSVCAGCAGGPALAPPAPPIADEVNHPAHYKQGAVEVIDIIEGAQLGFHLGNAVKYILRAPHKGKRVDIEKAAWYLARYLEKNA